MFLTRKGVIRVTKTLNLKIAKSKKTGKSKTMPARQIDPLYVIFEQHLFNFSDEDSDRKTFITAIVNDYLDYLRKNNIIVPKSLEQPILEELGTQVNTMLVKKIYGCLSITDYQDAVPGSERKRAKKTYAKVTAKAPPEKKTG